MVDVQSAQLLITGRWSNHYRSCQAELDKADQIVFDFSNENYIITDRLPKILLGKLVGEMGGEIIRVQAMAESVGIGSSSQFRQGPDLNLPDRSDDHRLCPERAQAAGFTVAWNLDMR